MTRPATPPILSELRSSTSPASQVAALRALKNEIIGHDQKKEMWVSLGVLAPLARILNNFKGSGKRRQQSANGTTLSSKGRVSGNEDEEARLQAIIIVGSLAHGGSAYIPPLIAASIIHPLFAILLPNEFSSQVVLASLRTLNVIADSLSLEHPSIENSNDGLVNVLYSDQNLNNLLLLLSQDSSSIAVQQEISLTAALITKTCKDEKHRRLLSDAGVIEALASSLARFVAATLYGVGLGESFQPVANNSDIVSKVSQTQLASILEAIGTIIDTSKSRALQFLSAPTLTAVFGPRADQFALYDNRAINRSSHGVVHPGAQQLSPSFLDMMLPQMPISSPRASSTQTSNFPPLGAIGTSSKHPRTLRTFGSAIEVIHNQAADTAQDEENPLIGWLLYVARAESGVTRLVVASVIGLLYRSGLTTKRRETSMAMLLVPLLVRMLDKSSSTMTLSRALHETKSFTLTDWYMKEQAPSVLAMLTLNSLEIQRAAVDAGAIKKLSQLLKESYDPTSPSLSATLWAPNPSSSDLPNKGGAFKFATTGLSPFAHHLAKLRESVLLALASVASLKDEYRKAIIEHGVVPFVIESLKPYSRSPSEQDDKTTANTALQSPEIPSGNSTSVILAACGAARGLSRSVSTLRTSLMDAGLAAPLFVLLRYRDVKVQIAATAVISNLVLEFSPMREAILEAGILKVLCEHAHSLNTVLRLNSVWALKHLVHTAPTSLKRDCLEELGPGWLKQIICDDSDEFSTASQISMGTSNAAGEQVDILNATNNLRGTGHDASDIEDDLKMVDSIGTLSRFNSDLKQSLNSRRFDQKPDGDVADQLRADDLAVQKQGLDFIRNLICGSDSMEMIDFLFDEFGQDKIFEIMISKLRPKLINAFNRERRGSEIGVRQIQPQTDIVISVCYIIVHIAAGLPRHRQLLISQPDLLKLIVPLFSHTHREVRGCCAWIVINLTWMDDQSDHQNCITRARELVKLGIHEKLEMLESDPELDVRERTKTAMHQINCALRSSG